jgi:hypothetical protein
MPIMTIKSTTPIPITVKLLISFDALSSAMNCTSCVALTDHNKNTSFIIPDKYFG